MYMKEETVSRRFRDHSFLTHSTPISSPILEGTLEDWPEFIDMHDSLIHNNVTLTSSQKFQYALKSTGEIFFIPNHSLLLSSAPANGV